MSRLVSVLRQLLAPADGAAEVGLLREVRGLLPNGASVIPRRLDGALVMLDVQFGPPGHASMYELCSLFGVDVPTRNAAQPLAGDVDSGAQLCEIVLPGLLILVSSEDDAVNDLRVLPVLGANGSYPRALGSAAAQHAETAGLMQAVLGVSAADSGYSGGGRGNED